MEPMKMLTVGGEQRVIAEVEPSRGSTGQVEVEEDPDFEVGSDSLDDIE